MFKKDQYLEHAEESPDFEEGDFITLDPNLVERVNREGLLNNVTYHVSTGIVATQDNCLELEFD
jgi:hypothetical protein